MARLLERLVCWSVLVVSWLGVLPASPSAAALRVATFRCDATPPLGGHPIIWTIPLQTVEDPLWAKGVVLEDGPQRYVLCAVDWCGLSNSSHLLFRRKIAAAAGTDVAHVTVHCLHQHTAPYTDGDAQRLLDRENDPPRYVDFRFLDQLTDRLAAAVRKSLGELREFDAVGTGLAKVDRVASSRRLPIGNGKVRSRLSSSLDPKLQAAPEGFIDPMLRTITLARGDKPLVRLHYYATHPQTFYGDPRASADCVGFARDRLEREEHVFQIYFTGCAGDIALGKYNDRTPRAREEITQRLLAGMKAAVAATHYGPAEHIGWKTVPLTLEARTDKGFTLAEMRAKVGDARLPVITRTRSATCVAFAERCGQPFELSALRIGPVSVLHLPGECMVEFQRYAQEARPDRFVAVAAYGDMAPGYVCTSRAFDEGGYEPTESWTGRSSEPRLKAAIRELLDVER